MLTFNTGETEAELRATYNPEGSVLWQAQKRLLDMAVYLNHIAQKLNIQIRLDGGNVLGAVRHGGFIPWDDDLDMVIDHKDYARFCKYLIDNPHPQYVLQVHSTDKHTYKEWACLRDLGSEHVMHDSMDARERRYHEVQKYRGLHVDIFPYENRAIPSLVRLAGKLSCFVNFDLGGKHHLLANMAYHTLHSIVFPTFRIIGRLFGDKDCYMHSYGAWFYCKFPEKVLRPYITIPFEGVPLAAPADPHEFCKILYKNYMDLPPKDKRDNHQCDVRLK